MKDFSRATSNEDQTEQMGRDIALALRKGQAFGDLIFLSGDLGAGKTLLARSIIRALSGIDDMEVPSPTYTLCHLYDTDPQIAHYDLYRLSSMDELEELGWEEQLETGVAIIEWPERCFDHLPNGAVQITIAQDGPSDRSFQFTGEGAFFDRLHRAFAISDFLKSTDFDITQRKPLSADASARSYEIVVADERDFFLMDSPKLPDGEPIRDGKPYSQIAHLAESVHGFVGVANLLRDAGAKVPEIPAFDLDQGLLLIEGLGDGLIIDEERNPIAERYLASVEMLAELHCYDFPESVAIDENETYAPPHYDEQAMLIEAELLLDWYAPAHSETPISDFQKDTFIQIWRDLFKTVDAYEKTLVIRDYHSPNIIWIENAKGVDQIGVIDFQDAVFGPSPYDVASLAQDARIDISDALENDIVNHYIKYRTDQTKVFDEARFREAYAIMAAQRATKILGIFIRLNERDGKPEYLKHLPRMRDYLARSLKHEVLAPYKGWVDSVIKL